jgi:hypothetical protein
VAKAAEHKKRWGAQHSATVLGDGSYAVSCRHELAADGSHTVTVNHVPQALAAEPPLVIVWEPSPEPGGASGMFRISGLSGPGAELAVEGEDKVTVIDHVRPGGMAAIAHMFPGAGSHVATVTDGDRTARVTVFLDVRQLDLRAEQDPADGPLTVRLWLPPDAEFPVTVQWDVPDPQSSFETVTQAPQAWYVRHTYPQPGRYTIDAEDAGDNQGSCTIKVA